MIAEEADQGRKLSKMMSIGLSLSRDLINRTLPLSVVAANNFGSGGVFEAERIECVVFHASG